MSVKKLDKMIGEMSAMGAGAVHGGASKEKEELNEEGADCIKDYMSMGYSYREALAECQDMDESKENTQTEALLRKYIREKLIAIRRQSINEEHQLRMVIRGMLQEAEDANPHPNTGINKLRDAFKKARPTIRRLYKQLTSSDDQRTSFTSHLLRGFQRMFDEVDALSGIQSAPATATDPNALSAPPADLAAPPEGDSDIDISVGPEDEQELDLGVDVPEEEEESLMDLAEVQIVSEQETSNLEKDLERKQGADSEREEFGSGLEGMDKTGRNQALDTMKLVKSYFSEPYGDLENDEDRKQFKDWALYNLDLLLKSYEDELQAGLQKPDIQAPAG